MKNKGFVVYGVVGVALSLAVVLTNTYGLSQMNKKAYNRFLSESKSLENLGFDGFTASDYKVRFFDGNQDYVATATGDFQKEKAVLDVLAGTAWQVDDEYQVLVPVYEKLEGMTEMLGGAESISAGENASAYTEDSYVSTISHEAFHCWQFTKFDQEISKSMDQVERDREEVITQDIDCNSAFKASIEKEAKLLEKALSAADVDSKKDFVNQALLEEADRREKLSKDAAAVEYFVETLEGSAQYIEACTYRDLAGEKAFADYYLNDFSYENGSNKYYKIGLMKCLLLDELQEGWQQDFTYENGTSMMLGNVLK